MKVEELMMKKYITPEIEIEIWAPNEDIMAASLEVSEEEGKLLGIIDVENLIGAIKNIQNIFK